MISRRLLACAAIALLTFVAACARPTRQELLDRSKEARTIGELKEAIGKPDTVEKGEELETWTYRAADGRVVFNIGNEKVVAKKGLAEGER